MIAGTEMVCSVTGWTLVTTILLPLLANQNAWPSASPLPTPIVMMTLLNPRLHVLVGRSPIASSIDE